MKSSPNSSRASLSLEDVFKAVVGAASDEVRSPSSSKKTVKSQLRKRSQVLSETSDRSSDAKKPKKSHGIMNANQGNSPSKKSVIQFKVKTPSEAKVKKIVSIDKLDVQQLSPVKSPKGITQKATSPKPVKITPAKEVNHDSSSSTSALSQKVDKNRSLNSVSLQKNKMKSKTSESETKNKKVKHKGKNWEVVDQDISFSSSDGDDGNSPSVKLNKQAIAQKFTMKTGMKKSTTTKTHSPFKVKFKVNLAKQKSLKNGSASRTKEQAKLAFSKLSKMKGTNSETEPQKRKSTKSLKVKAIEETVQANSEDVETHLNDTPKSSDTGSVKAKSKHIKKLNSGKNLVGKSEKKIKHSKSENQTKLGKSENYKTHAKSEKQTILALNFEEDSDSDSGILYSLPDTSSDSTISTNSEAADNQTSPTQKKATASKSHERSNSKSESKLSHGLVGLVEKATKDTKKSKSTSTTLEKAANGTCSGKCKKTRLLDSLTTSSAFQTVRPVSPIPLYNAVNLSSNNLSQPAVLPSTLPLLSQPSWLIHDDDDLPPDTAQQISLPISPATMSYKVLLQNLPHQLHPKKSKSNGSSDVEDIERRVSVRATECAFRYKEIVIKKCQKYTQIWLNTHTKMKNCLNPAVMQEISSALSAAKYDDSTLVLFSGLGNVFCSGVDLHYLTTGDKKAAARKMVTALRDLIHKFITFPKLIIAVVPGAAIGLGAAILPLCDIVYASDKATFYMPYAQLAQTPEGCASYTLPDTVGTAMANELLIGGRKITAIEACQLGLVSQVYWPTSMMQEVIPRVQHMALLSGKVLETTKLLMRSHQRTRLDLTNESECNLLMDHWPSAECQRAIEEFVSNEKNYVL